MKRLAVLLSLAFLPTAVAHADGCPATTCGTTSVAVPGSSLVLVRPNGQKGPLEGYTAANGVRTFRLPRGLLAADGRSFVTATSRAGRTAVRLYDVSSGARLVHAWTFAGSAWPMTISADGSRLVLQERSARATSRIALFDTRLGRVVDRIALRGSYQPEAISPNGRRLFLIHWTRDSYDLRTFERDTRRLHATRLAEPDEKMVGTPMTAVETRDGHWLLTLYVESDGMAFVHALDLRTGIAHCIDLPWHGADFNQVGTAAMTLSPDQQKLYVANPLLGHMTVADLRTTRVVRNIHFAPIASPALFPYGSWPSAAVTPNGRVLAFSGARSLWLYDTAYGIVRGPFAAGRAVPPRTGVRVSVTALAFAPGGRRLTALTSDRSRASFDAATGRRLDAAGPAELFAVRSGGLAGTLMGYDTTGGPRFVLPNGRASADGTEYFASLPRRGGRTAIEQYSPVTGRFLRAHVLRGRWTLGAVSASGTTIAIARHANRTTWVRVLDAATARTVNARRLRGVYTLDAVNDDGRRLFLIQHYRGGTYAVRALDFKQGRLWTATLREKGVEEEPEMTGLATGQVASPDGKWLLTMYLNTKDRKAFVHALNLRQSYAVCIDLPSRSRAFRELRDYSLALAPDGGVYAANGALGVLARVDLQRQSVVDTLRFDSSRWGGGWSASAISRDGRLLYFASGKNVWRFDASRGAVRGPVAAPGPVLGFAFSRDGRRVFAARADGGVAAFSALSGEALKA